MTRDSKEYSKQYNLQELLLIQFSNDQLKFLGHTINEDGITADPAKVQAVLDLPPPSNVSQMRQFVGMINQLAKFVSNCAHVIHPLTELCT